MHAFVFARMRFVDEARPQFRALSWISFLEAIVRTVSRSVRVPTDAHMRELGTRELGEFYEALAAHAENDDDGHDKVRRMLLPDDQRPLASKVRLVLIHIFQNHAIAYRGIVKTDTHSVDLKRYLSEKQRERWLTQKHPRTRRAIVEAKMLTDSHHKAKKEPPAELG